MILVLDCISIGRLLSLLMCLAVVSGCAAKTIRVVDPEGNPISGALVISEHPPYIGTKWKLAVGTTDVDGFVKSVNNRGTIIAPGYYPVIESNDIGTSENWSARAHLRRNTTLFPIRPDSPRRDSVRTIDAWSAKDKKTYKFAGLPCDDVYVEYGFASSSIRVTSDSKLTPSDRFYFLGPSKAAVGKKLEREGFISFYCSQSGSINKIGIDATSRIWMRGNPRHTLTVYEAENIDFTDYIQPSIGCVTKDSFSWWGEVSNDTPAILTTSRPIDFSVFVNASPKCSRQRLMDFAAYFERIN